MTPEPRGADLDQSVRPRHVTSDMDENPPSPPVDAHPRWRAGALRRFRWPLWAAAMSIGTGAVAFAPASGADIDLDGLSYSVQNADRPWSLAVAEPDRLRFELRPGDVWSGDTPVKERTEIAGATIYATGSDVSINYDFRVAPGTGNTAEWLLLGQMHADDPLTAPIFALELIGEHLAVHIRNKQPDGRYEEWFAYTDDQPIVRGHYYTVEVRLHTHDDDNGSVDVWIDGEHVVDYAGPLGYGYGSYWKHGIYRAAAPETMVVDYHNFSIREEAAPR